jgi:hypothetical protein
VVPSPPNNPHKSEQAKSSHISTKKVQSKQITSSTNEETFSPLKALARIASLSKEKSKQKMSTMKSTNGTKKNEQLKNVKISERGPGHTNDMKESQLKCSSTRSSSISSSNNVTNDVNIFPGKLIKYAFQNEDKEWIWYVGVVNVRKNKSKQKDSFHEVLFDDGEQLWVQLDAESKGKYWKEIKDSQAVRERHKFDQLVQIVNAEGLEKLNRDLMLMAKKHEANNGRIKPGRPQRKKLQRSPPPGQENQAHSKPVQVNQHSKNSQIKDEPGSQYEIQTKNGNPSHSPVENAGDIIPTIPISTRNPKLRDIESVKLLKLKTGEYFAIKTVDKKQLTQFEESNNGQSESLLPKPRWVIMVEEAYLACSKIAKQLDCWEDFGQSIDHLGKIKQMVAQAVDKIPQKDSKWVFFSSTNLL